MALVWVLSYLMRVFRVGTLNRYVDQKKIINAFKILKDYKINRTAYNMIGLEGQTEKSIIETIKFNILLNPEVSSVAYYSAYDGTNLGSISIKNYVTQTFNSHSWISLITT